MNRLDDLQADAAKRRAELASTLDAIEDKLNVPKQARIAFDDARRSFRRDPLPWIAGAVAVAATTVGAVVWAIRSR